MKKLRCLVSAFLVVVANCLALAGAPKISVESLPDLVVAGTNPQQGVAGAFSALVAGKIVVAGGCNFPEKSPADGGKKVYYDTIWELDLGASEAGWRISDHKLPAPAAYGVSASYWVGGENAEKKLDTALLPPPELCPALPLPVALDNATGSATTIAGGNADGAPATKAFLLDKENSVWRELPDFAGNPRVQPVCGFVKTPRGKAFALVGGFAFYKEKNAAVVDCAGVIYFPEEKKWERIPALPAEVSGAGLVGAAAMEYDGGLLIVGGVNAKIFKNALENPAPDYLRHEAEWYKFNADVLFLSFDNNGKAVWQKLGSAPELARAGASLVPIGDGEFVYVCGELKPGFRSTKCVRVKIEK